MSESACSMAGQGAMIVAGSRQHGEGNAACELPPASPARQLRQNVRTHQPDETRTWKLPQQAAQRVDRVARAEHLLDGTHQDVPVACELARRCQALAEWRHPAFRLQRIPRRHEQPYLVETQTLPCKIDDVAVTRMRRIERTTKKTDPHSPPVAEAGDWLMPVRRLQGRTCPVPMTR